MLLFILSSLVTLGCIVPDYCTPTGFNGTLHRHLFSEQIVTGEFLKLQRLDN